MNIKRLKKNKNLSKVKKSITHIIKLVELDDNNYTVFLNDGRTVKISFVNDDYPKYEDFNLVADRDRKQDYSFNRHEKKVIDKLLLKNTIIKRLCEDACDEYYTCADKEEIDREVYEEYKSHLYDIAEEWEQSYYR